jgi:nickel transport protein
MIPLLVWLCVLGLSSAAHAHRLEAEAVLRPGWQVQVEGWYETGESADGARVEVFRGDDVVTQGRLNKQGVFTFTYRESQALRIVVNAGGGHRAETTIPAENLTKNAACTAVACLQPTAAPFLAAPLLVPVQLADAPAPALPPVVERQTGMQGKNLLIGVGVLLGVAMLAVMWRRLRQRGESGPRNHSAAGV